MPADGSHRILLEQEDVGDEIPEQALSPEDTIDVGDPRGGTVQEPDDDIEVCALLCSVGDVQAVEDLNRDAIGNSLKCPGLVKDPVARRDRQSDVNAVPQAGAQS